MHFGFSYVGLIYLIMLFVPNIIWARHKPEDYDQYVQNESKILQAFERVGQVLVCISALIFSDFNFRPWATLWTWWLVVSFMFMILYELYWIRYFRSERTMRDQYCRFCGFPVAGATLPLIAFFLLGIYGVNIWLIIAVGILAIGHIGIHRAHEREINGLKPKPHVAKRILKRAGAVLLVIVILLMVIPVAVRNFRFLRHQGNFIHGVEEQTFVSLGGQDQYVLMMGRDVTNPVIIYLHGGPATPDTMIMYTFSDYLMDDYTFVGWDQRGCGRTYYRNIETDPDNETVNFEQALQDLDELVDYVRTRFNREKVIIMGHSYGTILGSRYVQEHPEKVSDYVGVGQSISLMEGDMRSYEDALEKAKEAGDDTSKMEEIYEEYLSDKTLVNLLTLRVPVSKYHKVAQKANGAWIQLTSPHAGVDDFKWILLSERNSELYMRLNSELFDYLDEYHAFAESMDYQVPVHFISGAEDWTCPVNLVEEYKNAITAPEKDLTLIPEVGHSPQFAVPEEFANAVREVLAD